jgi:hypothetical protein
MKHPLLLALVFSLVTAVSAFAAEGNPSTAQPSGSAQANPLHFLLGAGVTGGGDKVATAIYTDGSTKSVNGGGLFLMYAGVEYRVNDVFSAQGSLGYHVDQVTGTNGDITFGRFPLEFMGYYHINDQLRLGGGARFVNGAKVKGSGVVSNINASFDNAVGMVIEGEYMTSPKIGVKVRYVKEEYQLSGTSVKYDGSHFGLLANVYF